MELSLIWYTSLSLLELYDILDFLLGWGRVLLPIPEGCAACYVAETGLELLAILLPQLPECQNDKPVPSHQQLYKLCRLLSDREFLNVVGSNRVGLGIVI